MNALVITSHYIPWKDSRSTAGESFVSGDTRALRLKVEYDHTEPTPDEPVKCHVETERIGFRGYGMMLAEVGLPPGSEVERESLETARDSGSIQGYEVQPDRVVFYVWPEASGSKFEFQFRLRYGMDAMTAPSRALRLLQSRSERYDRAGTLCCALSSCGADGIRERSIKSLSRAVLTT